MDASLRRLLSELAQFGNENDAGERSRQEKMLNITPETGELLAILVLATRAKRVLEIGTSNGYSTLWLADAAKAMEGRVVTIESNPSKVQMARENFERAGLSQWIRQEVMDAGAFLRRQAADQYDLLFLDSDRTQYAGWWLALQGVIAPGGLLVVDNAVSHPAEMKEFIERVRATPDWRTVVLPVGKGEFVALKSREHVERGGPTGVGQ